MFYNCEILSTLTSMERFHQLENDIIHSSRVLCVHEEKIYKLVRPVYTM